MRARTRWMAVVGGVVLTLALGCGDDTPMGGDLASPAEREAVPDPMRRDPTPPERPEEREAAPRVGAPAAIGEAPERPVQAVERQREGERPDAR